MGRRQEKARAGNQNRRVRRNARRQRDRRKNCQYGSSTWTEPNRGGTGAGTDTMAVGVPGMGIVRLGRLTVTCVSVVAVLIPSALGEQPGCVDRARIDERNDGSRHRG